MNPFKYYTDCSTDFRVSAFLEDFRCSGLHPILLDWFTAMCCRPNPFATLRQKLCSFNWSTLCGWATNPPSLLNVNWFNRRSVSQECMRNYVRSSMLRGYRRLLNLISTYLHYIFSSRQLAIAPWTWISLIYRELRLRYLGSGTVLSLGN